MKVYVVTEGTHELEMIRAIFLSEMNALKYVTTPRGYRKSDFYIEEYDVEDAEEPPLATHTT
jgi:hypothetical protein